ncbi:MAG: sporulation protein YtfJ [Ruminococcaceae bacterium]|nr:sporulation protein YtfJ [Oscillospiraceae bacterium]
MAENKLGEIISTSLAEIKKVVEANTIIGEPISTPSGTVIIPVSKVSMGFASGGVDFADKEQSSAKKLLTFSGGGGTGVSVTPVAFLVVSSDGKVTMLNVANPPEAPDYIGSVTGLIEKSPDIVAKLKDVFKKDSE